MCCSFGLLCLCVCLSLSLSLSLSLFLSSGLWAGEVPLPARSEAPPLVAEEESEAYTRHKGRYRHSAAVQLHIKGKGPQAVKIASVLVDDIKPGLPF